MTVEVTNVPEDTLITLKQGTYVKVSLTFRRSTTLFFDLTNYDVKVTVRTQYGSDEAVIYASSETTGPGASKVDIIDPTNGEAAWLISPSDTDGFVWPNLDDDTADLPFDVELHKKNDPTVIYSPIRGTITLVREVTRT